MSLAALYGSCWLAFYLVLRLVFAGELAHRRCIQLASAALALYWTGMPHPGETIYWLTGGVEDSLPFVLSVCSIWLLASATELNGYNKPRRVSLAIGACVLIVLVTGLHEIAAIVITLILTVATAAARRMKTRVPYWWPFALLVAAIGTSTCAFAPGNGVRSAWIARTERVHDLTTTVRVSILQFEEYLIPWLLDVKLLAASVFLLASPWFHTPRPGWVLGSKSDWKILIPCTCLISVCLVFLLVAWSIGTAGPNRLYDSVYAVFLVGWFISLFVWSRAFHSDLDNARTRMLSGLVLAVALLASGNTVRALRDFMGKETVMGYHSAMRQRFADLIKERSEGRLDVTVTDAPPSPPRWTAKTGQ